MNKLFVEKLFRLKFKFECDFNSFSNIEIFPDDGKSFEINQIQIESAKNNERIIDALITEYFNSHR